MNRNKGKLTCNALRRARHTKAAQMAKRAVKPAVTPPTTRIEKTLARMTTKTYIDHLGIERYITNEKRAAELLADAILRSDKRCGKAKPHAGARVGRAFTQHRKRANGNEVPAPSPRKRWGIYPLAQNGAVSEIPVVILNTKGEADARCHLLAQWGKHPLTVREV